MRALILGLVALGCGSSDTTNPRTDFTCHQGDRTGTYLIQFTTRSGDCGNLPEQIGRLDNAMGSAGTMAACVDTAPNRWSDADCTLERSYRCDANDGSSADFVAITTQQDPSGSRLTGLITIHATSPAGQPCTGTYDVMATRQ